MSEQNPTNDGGNASLPKATLPSGSSASPAGADPNSEPVPSPKTCCVNRKVALAVAVAVPVAARPGGSGRP